MDETALEKLEHLHQKSRLPLTDGLYYCITCREEWPCYTSCLINDIVVSRAVDLHKTTTDQDKIARYIAEVIEKIEADRDSWKAYSKRFADAIRDALEEYDRDTTRSRALRSALSEHDALIAQENHDQKENAS